MIIKGGPRASPRQLARSLAQAGPGDSVEILELQSAWACPAYGPQVQLTEAFRDWQILVEGTAQGKYGLYHAQVNPAPGRTLTSQQCRRAADVLEEKLGLQDQPRALVLRNGAGRQRLHAVWQRMDIDTWTLRHAGFNYLAHEQASAQLAREFGHDSVPGKIRRDSRPE